MAGYRRTTWPFPVSLATRRITLVDARSPARRPRPEMPAPGIGDAMANVLITGGAGFLGSRLARDLLAAGSLEVAGSEAQPLDRLTLVDRAPVPADLAADERVTAIRGRPRRPAGPGRRRGATGRARRGRRDLPSRRGGQRGMRSRLRPRHAGQPARHRGAARRLPRARDRARSWCSRVRWPRSASPRDHPLPGGRGRSDPAEPADQLRRAEGHRRAAAWPTTRARDSCAGGPCA